MTLEDTKIYTGLQNSDFSAFKTIFNKYQSDIFNFLHYKTGNVQVAEDILQETFIKLWENRKNIKADLSLKSYIYTISNNMALNYFRHKKIVQKHQIEKLHEGKDYYQLSPDTIYEKKELQTQIMQAINKLPKKSKIVFMLSRFNKLSYIEIAERLNISIKTVESHIGKSLKILRKSLKNY
ncbi:MAG: RNA polymerase sigma-70 factor [Calditrichia bacterium]|nr:RNA polymerase sigma-70 factor [Calditrichia bacterium]